MKELRVTRRCVGAMECIRYVIGVHYMACRNSTMNTAHNTEKDFEQPNQHTALLCSIVGNH